jgi:hypothetical protein
MDKDRAVRKWSPILNTLGFTNKKIVHILSIYCEKYCEKRSDSQDLTSELKKLYHSISRMAECTRIEVVKTYYNTFLGKMQYELSNGAIIDEDNQFERVYQKINSFP